MPENFDEEALKKIQEEANMNRLSVAMEQDERELPIQTIPQGMYSPLLEYAIMVKSFLPHDVNISHPEFEGQQLPGLNTFKYKWNAYAAMKLLEKRELFVLFTQPPTPEPLTVDENAIPDEKRRIAYANMVQAQLYENRATTAALAEDKESAERFELIAYLKEKEAYIILRPLEEFPSQHGFHQLIEQDAEDFFTGYSEARIVDDGPKAFGNRPKETRVPEQESKAGST